jgi:hypothetical protein
LRADAGIADCAAPVVTRGQTEISGDRARILISSSLSVEIRETIHACVKQPEDIRRANFFSISPAKVFIPASSDAWQPHFVA